MNSKDKQYFAFKNIINDSSQNKDRYFGMIYLYSILKCCDNETIQHFSNIELSNYWWNKTNFYIYYNEHINNVINQIINADRDEKEFTIKVPNKKQKKTKSVTEFNLTNEIKFIFRSS